MNETSGVTVIRGYSPDDKNFICATFLRGLYYGDSWFSQVDKKSFMENYEKVINALLASPKVKVHVICVEEDPETIIGYSILSTDETTLHWVFVKSRWRHLGVGRSLIPTTISCVTHLTDLGKSLLSKINNPKFNPFNY